MTHRSRSKAGAKLLATAIEKTEDIQERLGEAVVELKHTNSTLTTAMSTAQAAPAVASAVDHNKAAEAKVHEATEDLESVKDLLKDAQVAQAELLRAGGRSGEGAASVVPHLDLPRP